MMLTVVLKALAVLTMALGIALALALLLANSADRAKTFRTHISAAVKDQPAGFLRKLNNI